MYSIFYLEPADIAPIHHVSGVSYFQTLAVVLGVSIGVASSGSASYRSIINRVVDHAIPLGTRLAGISDIDSVPVV